MSLQAVAALCCQALKWLVLLLQFVTLEKIGNVKANGR